MILFPSLDETILSKMSPEEICEVMRAVTIPRKEHYYGDRRGEFIGEVSAEGFRVTSNVCSIWCRRRHFFPIISGKINVKGRISIVTIKMRLHWAVPVFMTIWFGFVAAFMLKGLFLLIADGSGFTLLLGTSVMMLLGQCMIRYGFCVSAKRALKKMRELFGA